MNVTIEKSEVIYGDRSFMDFMKYDGKRTIGNYTGRAETNMDKTTSLTLTGISKSDAVFLGKIITAFNHP